MYVSSKSLTVDTSVEKLFAFLSKEENLPKWAIHYCQGIRKEGEDYIITTPQGESYFAIQADPANGIVDMLGGPCKEEMMTCPVRVVALPDGRSHLTMTCIIPAEMSEEDIQGLEQSFKEEFAMLSKQVSAA